MVEINKIDEEHLGLTTPKALERLHNDIEETLKQYENLKKLKRIKKCIKDSFHHSSFYTPLSWTSIILITFYATALFTCFIIQEIKPISLLYESLVIVTILSVNIWYIYTENKLRHDELPRRVRIILEEIKRAVSNEPWKLENYPHLCSPYSPCITLQWTYRDGILINLPWALLVKDDIVLIRPGQVSPGYCEAVDKSEEYPLLHPKEVYGPSLKNANESISLPKVRRPLPNRRYRLLETPYLSNLHLALEQALEKPPTMLNRRRTLIITRSIEQFALPICLILSLFVGIIKRLYLYTIFDVGDAVEVYILTPAAVVLPLMPLMFPVAWFLLNNIGNAKLRAIFDTYSNANNLFHLSFDDGDSHLNHKLPEFGWRKLWNNFLLITYGTGHIMTRSSNLLHVLGSVTALCCVDKKGILSWPNPTAEKVFFLHNSENDSKESSLENVGDINTDTDSVDHRTNCTTTSGTGNANTTSTATSSSVRYKVANLTPACTVAEVLDLTHDHQDPFKLHFDDKEWSRYISSLKPLGLAILLNTCNLDTQEHYAQFCAHITCEAMYNENLIPVTNRRCLCELAKQIGFLEHAQKVFRLEQQLSTFRHLQPETMRRDNKFARSLQLSTKLKFPFPHMVAVVVKESNSCAYQLLSQGTADIVLDSCVDYWDGQDLCFLTPSDRKKALDFYQRTSLTAYCTAFAYRPLTGNFSNKLSQLFLELPSDSKQLFKTRRSPTPIYWDCRNIFETKYKGPLAQFFSTDSLLYNDNISSDLSNSESCFDVQCNQVFIGMVTMQYQVQTDMVHLIEQLERACIRFVHFSKENELRSRVFSEKMGLESGWNCHISLISERNRRDSGPSECWANNGTARVYSPTSIPQRKPGTSPASTTPRTNTEDSNLEQSRALSFSAPSAINLEHSTVKFDPEVEHPASCGDSGEGHDFDSSEESMLLGSQPERTTSSPTHEHWQSLSCLTDSTEQSAPVHFDMSNRAKLPRGIDKIRPHIEQIDNVPLLVSLFTDCTPPVIREMLNIMQDFGEIVCVICSSANAENMGICLQADAAIAVEPLYPQVCQRVPAYSQSETSPSPVELSRILNSVSCALSARREDPLAVYPLVMYARHYTRALWSCIQFWICCNTTVCLIQLFAAVSLLPPIFTTGHVLWLSAVINPLLSISLTFLPINPTIMQHPMGKETFKVTSEALKFISWCYGIKFLPVIISSIFIYFAALSTYCIKICSSETLNCTCKYYYSPYLNENYENKWGWRNYEYTLIVAQHSALINTVILFIVISISFVNREHSIWKIRPCNNFIWMCSVLIIIILHTFYTLINLCIIQKENQLGLGDLSYFVIIFIIISIFFTFFFTEFIKWKEIKVNLRYQRRARLDFGTKLGMNSPF